MTAEAPPEAGAAEAQTFTGKEFRQALGSFATGVTVVTTRGPEHDYGMTANAFSSVSMDPPLVLVCVITQSEGREILEQNGVFAVNILAADQEPLSNFFASRERPRGRDAFSKVAYRTEVSGAPVLEGAAAYLDCRLHETHEAGDHLIFIGEVLALGVDAEAKPLLFHGGGYRFLRDDV
jgi:flavin reductase (DIM6/NTAB) family NADH-FMN oxidoreductase RutF